MYPKSPGNYLHLPQHEYHENMSSMSSNLLKSMESIYSRHFSSAFKKSCEPEKEQKNSKQAAETRQIFAKEWVEYPLLFCLSEHRYH